MRILDRYIVREIFRHAFLGLIVFTFVLFVPQLVRLMELLVRHSGSGAQIVKLFLYIFPGVLIFTIPMAVLVGVLLGLGRMSADSEIIALTALGTTLIITDPSDSIARLVIRQRSLPTSRSSTFTAAFTPPAYERFSLTGSPSPNLPMSRLSTGH